MASNQKRNERLAAALRENLKRRKARDRTVKSGSDDNAASSEDVPKDAPASAPIPPRTVR
jgi:hypothetical protein